MKKKWIGILSILIVIMTVLRRVLRLFNINGVFIWILIAVSLVLIIVYVYSNKKMLREAFDNTYADIIGNAFADDKSKKKKLYTALDMYNRNMYDLAEKVLLNVKKECVTDDDFFAVSMITALCYDESGKYDKAIEAYKETLAYRQDSVAWSNLGLMYVEMTDRENAEKAFLKAIELDEKNPYPYCNIANLYLEKKENDKALTYAEKAFDVDEEFPNSAAVLAICHSVIGNSEEAEKYVKIAVANGHDEPSLREAMNDYRKFNS